MPARHQPTRPHVGVTRSRVRTTLLLMAAAWMLPNSAIAQSPMIITACKVPLAGIIRRIEPSGVLAGLPRTCLSPTPLSLFWNLQGPVGATRPDAHGAAEMTAGVFLAAGGGSWLFVSDARKKTAFQDVDGEQLLNNLRAMPVRSWQYKSQGTSIRHMGPTAQDFRSAFGVGESDTTITSVDADGVALAAARALEARTRALRTENAALREELRAVRTAAMAARRDVAALWTEVSALRRQSASTSHDIRTATTHRTAAEAPVR